MSAEQHTPPIDADERNPMRAVLRGLLHSGAVVVPIALMLAVQDLLTYNPSDIDWYVVGVAVSFPIIGWPCLAAPAVLYAWYEEPLVGRYYVFGRVPGRKAPPGWALLSVFVLGLFISMLLFSVMPWAGAPG